MDFYLGRSDWKTLQRGEEHSFLLVNGLGGYCSQTVIGSNARHDHNLLTAALVAPTKRFAMVRRIEEILHVGSNAYRLDSQAYVTSSDDAAGFRFLDSFFYDGLPSWEYMAEGVRVTKRLTLVYGTNSLAIQYQLYADEGVDAWIEVIAEIYDGECPAESRGCFAQAWSVAELLRAYEDAETAVVFGRNI